LPKFFDRISSLIDVAYIAANVRPIVFGLGRVGGWFITLAALHGVRWFRTVDADWTSEENYASGVPESDMGIPKLEQTARSLARISPRISFDGMVSSLTAEQPLSDRLIEWVASATHAVLAIDSFAVTTALARALYPRIPSFYAGLQDSGRTGLIAWSHPGRTPCLDCTAGLSRLQGESGGQTLCVDVTTTVNFAFQQFLGVVLEDRLGGEEFAAFADPSYCLGYVANRPGGSIPMSEDRRDLPAGVRLVRVIDDDGIGPSCDVCRGYGPRGG